ncbi:MAG: Crp/Fnr family transcriptional regulator [Puniceicoccales bacterium]|jgi:CRP/FNR family transcriptional regulator|nr:Crp/Fnr family transcriptional regulator [Puniceicoccales bacterium]
MKPIIKGPQISGTPAQLPTNDSRVRPIARKLSSIAPQTVIEEASIKSTLQDMFMFRDCSAEEINRVTSIAQIYTLQKGDTLFQQGDPAQGFYIVLQGIILLYSTNIGGKEQVSCSFRENEIFGEDTLHGMENLPLTARAFVYSVVILIPRNSFLQLIALHPRIALNAVTAMARRLDKLTEQIAELKIHDVEERLLIWIARRIPSEAVAASINLGIKRILATEIGTSSETLSRLLARLKKKGLVTIKGRLLSMPSCQAFMDYLHQTATRHHAVTNLPVENE